MKTKRTYISPSTAVLVGASSEPIMVEMTMYSDSTYGTFTTIEFGPNGYTSSDGSW